MLEAIIGPLIGGLFSGIFGGGNQPAAAGAESSARAQADLINLLMSAFKNLWHPAQAELMSRYLGFTRQLPLEDINQFQILSDLLPVMVPEILRAQGELGVRRGAERNIQSLERSLNKRGMSQDDPYRQALINRVREGEVLGLADLMSKLAQWEAEQTYINREKAFNRAMGQMASAGQYSQLGSAFPGTAIAGAGDLSRLLAQQAQAAQQPWNDFAAGLSKAFQSWFAQPSYGGGGGYSTGGTNINPWVYPVGGGGGGTYP